MIALKVDKEIGNKINKIIGRIAEANELKGILDVADFNDTDKCEFQEHNTDDTGTQVMSRMGHE